VKPMAPILALILALGIDVVLPKHRRRNGPTIKKIRVADLVRTGKLRVGIWPWSPSGAMKNPSDWRVARLAVGPGACTRNADRSGFRGLELSKTRCDSRRRANNAWDVAFLVVDPERAKEVDFAPPPYAKRFHLSGARWLLDPQGCGCGPARHSHRQCRRGDGGIFV